MILTDEERSKVLGFNEFTTEPMRVTLDLIARAIESAVLEKLCQQEPVVTINRNASGQIHMVCADGNSFDMSERVGKSFYAAPFPAGVLKGDDMKLRWLVGKLKQESKHDWCGNKWKNEWELHTEKILQYSLDGKTWEDVECEYFEVHQEDVHKYKWK